MEKRFANPGEYDLNAFRDAPRENPKSAGVRIVHNRLLGGWFIVRGPHQTPIGGRFDSKAAAQAHLDRDRPGRAVRIVRAPFQNPKRRVVAWTGGSSWKSGTGRGREFALTPEEKAIARKLYDEQARVFTQYWKRKPDKDTRDIFRARANADAYATVRAGETRPRENPRVRVAQGRARKIRGTELPDHIELRGVKTGKTYARMSSRHTTMKDLKLMAKAIARIHGEAVSAHRRQRSTK